MDAFRLVNARRSWSHTPIGTGVSEDTAEKPTNRVGQSRAVDDRATQRSSTGQRPAQSAVAIS
jgi:hypothetical protein